MIRRLRVENFKAFRRQAFRLAPLTLLSGLNGAGKSSLLQALLVLRQSFETGVLDRGRLALNGELIHLGRFEDALFEGAGEETITVELDSEAGTFRGAWGYDADEERVGIPQGALFEVDRDLSLFNAGFRFLAAERIGPRIHHGVPDADSVAAGLGVQGEWTPHFLANHGDSVIGVLSCGHPQARSSQLGHQVEAWMSEISPGIQIHFDRERELDLVRLSYSFVSARNTSRRFRPTNVGFGVSYTIPVITAVLAAKPGDLILLESPEAHLHPRGQARLGALLAQAAAAGVQIIVESHSDHIMNGVRVAVHQDVLSPDQVRFLHFRRDLGESSDGVLVREIEMDTSGRIAEWPDGFFDELDRSLEILLAPKAI